MKCEVKGGKYGRDDGRGGEGTARVWARAWYGTEIPRCTQKHEARRTKDGGGRVRSVGIRRCWGCGMTVGGVAGTNAQVTTTSDGLRLQRVLATRHLPLEESDGEQAKRLEAIKAMERRRKRREHKATNNEGGRKRRGRETGTHLLEDMMQERIVRIVIHRVRGLLGGVQYLSCPVPRVECLVSIVDRESNVDTT